MPAESHSLASSSDTQPVRLFVLRDSTLIHAPIDRCFLLSTSIAIVQAELGMHAVAGRTQGLVQGGDIIRWEGWQLGLHHFHVSQINGYHRPVFFQDRMIAGRFKFFEHDHQLRQTEQGAVLEDELRFSMPFGFLGTLVGRWIMVPHIRKLMRERFALLKNIAESDRWREYLPSSEIPRRTADTC